MTELMREKLLQLVTEVESILTPKHDSQIVLGTPNHLYYISLSGVIIAPSGQPGTHMIQQTTKDCSPQLQKISVRNDGTVVKSQRQKNKSAQRRQPLISPGPQPTRIDLLNDLLAGKRQWDSNFMLQFMLDTSLSDASSLLKWQTWLFLCQSFLLDNVVWCSDPQNVIRTLHCRSTWRLFLQQCSSRRMEPLHRNNRSIDPSGRGTDETAAAYISQQTVFCTCTKCVLIEMDTLTTRSWTF